MAAEVSAIHRLCNTVPLQATATERNTMVDHHRTPVSSAPTAGSGITMSMGPQQWLQDRPGAVIGMLMGEALHRDWRGWTLMERGREAIGMDIIITMGGNQGASVMWTPGIHIAVCGHREEVGGFRGRRLWSWIGMQISKATTDWPIQLPVCYWRQRQRRWRFPMYVYEFYTFVVSFIFRFRIM